MMRCLPEDINDALSKFFSHLLHKDLASAKTGPDAEDNHDTEDDDPANEVYSDTHSENRSEQFYTAPDNLVNNLARDVPANHVPAKTSTEEFDDVFATPANAAWGMPVRQCQLMLKKLHQVRVAAGKSPDWPFADYLEFKFVKWMVMNDISQTAQDKLIKLPI
ncbi:hypothetical protein FRC06_005664, partial [Ceratobasidium sp. 370]